MISVVNKIQGKEGRHKKQPTPGIQRHEAPHTADKAESTMTLESLRDWGISVWHPP